jgi:hypothetical protein
MSSISAYVIPGTAAVSLLPASTAFYNGFLYFNGGSHFSAPFDVPGLVKMAPTGTSTFVQIDTTAGMGAVAYDSTTTSIFFLGNNAIIYKYGQGLLANKSIFYDTSTDGSAQPFILNVDNSGNVYWMDGSGTIFQIDPTGANGGVYVDLSAYLDLGNGIFMTIDSSKNIYVANNHNVIKVDSSGTVTDAFITIGGGGSQGVVSISVNPLNQNIWIGRNSLGTVDTYNSSGTLISAGYIDIGTSAGGNLTVGATFDPAGYYYFSDNSNIEMWTTQPSGVCLLEGTKILCLVGGAEKYVPIETIRKGTLVKTLSSGYKAVEFVGTSKRYNPPTDERSVERLYVCTSDEYPEITEDVVLTGAHSILVEKLTPEQKDATKKVTEVLFVSEKKFRLMACLDSRAKPYTVEGTYNVWHLSLEHTDRLMNYGMYANGLLVETASQRMISTLPGVRLV